MFDKYFTPCKGTRILDSEKFSACGIQNPGKFFSWDPESRALESRLELKYFEISQRNGIQNPRSTKKDWNPAPGIHNPRIGI